MKKIIRKIRCWLALKLIPKNERVCISMNVEELPNGDLKEFDEKILKELLFDMGQELRKLIKLSIRVDKKANMRIYRAEFPLVYDKRKEEK